MKNIIRFKKTIFSILFVFISASNYAEEPLFNSLYENWSLYNGTIEAFLGETENLVMNNINFPHLFSFTNSVNSINSSVITKSISLRYFAENNSVYLSAGQINLPIQIYINGILVSESGQFPPHYSFAEDYIPLIRIPLWSLNKNTPDQVLIRIAYTNDVTIIEPFKILTQQQYKNNKILNFLNSNMYFFYAFFSFFISIYFLSLYFFSKAKFPYYFYYAISAFCFGLYFFPVGSLFEINNFNQIYALSKSFLYPAVNLVALFFMSKFNILSKKRFKLIFIILSVLEVIWLNTNTQSISVIDANYNFLIFPILASILFIFTINTISYIKFNSKQALSILPGSFIALSFSLHDIIFHFSEIIPIINLKGPGFFIFNLFIFLSHALANIKFHKRAELDLKKMEEKITNKTFKLTEEISHLQKMARITEESNTAKSVFIKRMIHKMLTPLNGILGFSEIINSCKNKQDARYYASMIISESLSLNEIIHQITDFSSMETKNNDQNNTFCLKEIWSLIVKYSMIPTPPKNVKVNFSFSEDIPNHFKGNHILIHQILYNLIDNIIISTTKGEVEASVKLIEKKQSRCKLSFNISSSGISLNDEKIKMLTDNFNIEDSLVSTNKVNFDTAVGIAGQLITFLGGKFLIQSTKEGMNFSFCLSFEEISDVSESMTNDNEIITYNKNNKYLNILLVEDYPPNQMLAQAHLKDFGYQVKLAKNGLEAIKACTSESFDLILMDIQMPVMDGMEATSIIRKSNINHETPIIGITANTKESDAKICLDIGMNDVIIKPLRKKNLYKLLEKYLNKDQPHTKPTPPLKYQEFLLELDNNLPLAKNILSGFIQETGKQFKIIEELIIKGDYLALHREFHSIKGGALNIMADDIYKPAAKLTSLCKDNKLSGIDRYFKELKHQYNILKDYLEKSLNI